MKPVAPTTHPHGKRERERERQRGGERDAHTRTHAYCFSLCRMRLTDPTSSGNTKWYVCERGRETRACGRN